MIEKNKTIDMCDECLLSEKLYNILACLLSA